MDTTLREQILLLSQVPLYLVVIGIELFIMNFQVFKVYSIKETLQNIYLSLCCFGVDILFRVVYLAVFAWCFNHAFVTWEIKNVWYWLSLVVLQDFCFYWLHRNDHFIRFFWATHVTHHSAINYNITVGFRSSVLEPLYRFVYFIPLAFIGYEPIDILFVFSATQIWGTLIHTKAIGKLGFLEYIFVTPSHHRVHHASNAKYLDRNMGMFLIIWDKMFGTFQEEIDEKRYEPIRYGLTHNLENPNWIMLIFHEFVAIFQDVRQPGLSWKQRWNYIFNKPGYSHDDSRMTSEKMRLAEEQCVQKQSQESVVARKEAIEEEVLV
jgi:sterol desaturase/sphingolipid hydroxylase (fatty acid hydroxylase superfamily)